MIVGAAFVPQTPLLVPEIAQGAAAELDDLRSACMTAIRVVTDSAQHVLIVGAGQSTREYGPTSAGTFAGFGVPLQVSLGASGAGPVELPLSLAVGAWLTRQVLGAESGARGVAIADTAPEWAIEGRTALVVVGDGSARRSTAAPGYLDERAEAFDAAIADALARGDGAQLAKAADPVLGQTLLAAGVPAWRHVGELTAASAFEADLNYDGAPYGVGYFVATWTLRG